ncbi:HofP DNA utilization family protein [Atlantibacter sp.]|uniref:HofP DNA utilization family protein n=1 Tax=Atlantibacter sp. TaxID=1903473 RepID=UPI00289AF71C|nr:HofP DNA utilization family protein [Atlantibacter sp.]
MKVSSAVIFLMCSLAVAAEPRDPFQAPVDRCAGAQWDKWHFHGMVGGGAAIKAIMVNPDGKWLRASPGEPLTAELRVKEITVDKIAIATPPACGQGEIYWRLQEKFNDKDVQIHRVASAPANRAGRRARK